jgi:hypothetical protein
MKKPTKQEWDEICERVKHEMTHHVKHFITPISKVLTDSETGEEYGNHLGSGTFIEIENIKYIITNEHVAKYINNNPLAYQYWNCDSVLRIKNNFEVLPEPVDVAVVNIEEKAWNITSHESIPIPIDRFMSKHEPVIGEMLFMIGYSGERSKFLYKTLVNPGTPYLTQEKIFTQDSGENEAHFAIHYEPDEAVSFEDSYQGLPSPHGFSGSLVWNTRYVEFNQKRIKWSPSNAKVTGLIYKWEQNKTCLWATKVEQLPILCLCRKLN